MGENNILTTIALEKIFFLYYAHRTETEMATQVWYIE